MLMQLYRYLIKEQVDHSLKSLPISILMDTVAGQVRLSSESVCRMRLVVDDNAMDELSSNQYLSVMS
jgi:hypothetical protein